MQMLISATSSSVNIVKCLVQAGHAGSRIGWAIVGDAEVANNMRAWVSMGQISVESQARAALLLEHVVGNQGVLMLSWALYPCSNARQGKLCG